MTDSDALQGWWRLFSFHVEALDTGERVKPYGNEPLGSLIVADGRMAAILSSSERSEEDAKRFKTMFAFSGPCRVEDGQTLVIDVDAASHPDWIDSRQVRTFEIKGETLHMIAQLPTQPMFPGRAARSVMTWRRP